MEPPERIRAMEERLDRLKLWQAAFGGVLDGLEQAQEDLGALSAYLESEQWRRDFEDDEAGRLPAALKRGVLSEDGIFNALETQRELLDRLNEIM